MRCEICKEDLTKFPPAKGSSQPPTKKAKNDQPAGPNEPEIVCLPCGHIFHKACIMGSLATQNPNLGGAEAKSGECPICRQEVSVNRFYSVVPSIANVASSSSASSSNTPLPAAPAPTGLPSIPSMLAATALVALGVYTLTVLPALPALPAIPSLPAIPIIVFWNVSPPSSTVNSANANDNSKDKKSGSPSKTSGKRTYSETDSDNEFE